MKKRTLIYGLVVLLALLLAIMGVYYYHKPRASLEDVSPAYSVSASDWVEEYSSDEEAANNKYLGKVIEVTGVVAEIIQGEPYTILLSGRGFHNIQCVFPGIPDSIRDGHQIVPGDTLTVKGHCNGILLDIIINDCIIVEY